MKANDCNNMDPNTFLTYETAASLLRPKISLASISAEDERSWARQWTPALGHLVPGSVLDELWDCSLMRTYDAVSGSPPHHIDSRMLARNARMRLDEEDTRIETLSKHADHTTRVDTPYISFTNRPQSLQELANWRETRNRGDQWIVVVDPRVRFELRLPIIRYSEEMTNYSIEPPYRGDYWRNHYLCLWEVTPEEVVGVWDWDDLRHESNWYEEIIMPAVNRYRENRNSNQPEQGNPQPDVYAERDSSDALDDTDDELYWSDSDDSYERVCDENWAGQVMKMYEDLRLD